MRKSMILLLTMLFLAVSAFVSAAMEQRVASDTHGVQVAPVERTYSGSLPFDSASTVQNPGEANEILLTKRDDHRGRRGNRGHHRFRGHHGFKKHNFGHRRHFKGHHFGRHHFKRHDHHRGFRFFSPFYNYSHCYRYSPFYGYYKLPYSYCRYR